MPKYLIERQIPGVGTFTPQQLQDASRKSNEVLADLGPSIQWVQSYVTPDALYCVYIAPSEELIREHAERGGFPANKITRIDGSIDPTTGGV